MLQNNKVEKSKIPPTPFSIQKEWVEDPEGGSGTPELPQFFLRFSPNLLVAGFQLKNPNVGVRCDNVDSKHSFNGTDQRIFNLATISVVK
jgi:hypothetical protein